MRPVISDAVAEAEVALQPAARRRLLDNICASSQAPAASSASIAAGRPSSVDAGVENARDAIEPVERFA